MFVTSHDGGYEGPAPHRPPQEPADADKTEPFLDMNRIVYGIAFHPDYAKNITSTSAATAPTEVKIKKIAYRALPSKPSRRTAAIPNPS